ncbi:ARO9 [Candida pseudojiufengensis]|uniref:ARO9 n=1 Tax=Candida pseudojiufengensis TaxID=497109 RepID=UPI0022244F60|nr:ARO9 [Candida pseudojiufengensis]KAI5965941.1 ARO9 [Candida pseudojiufengensis]
MTGISHLISKRAKSRQSSHFTNGPSEQPPKGFKPHEKPLLLSYGTPNDGFFPIDSIDVNLVEYPFEHQQKFNNSMENLSISEKNPNSVHIERHTKNPNLIDLSKGLQYVKVEGHDPLIEFTENFIKRTHPPNYDNWSSILTTGASDGLNKACDAILDPGDVILVEEFTFTPFLRFSDNSGAIPVPIKIDLSNDSNGIDLNYLENLLKNWDTTKLPKPKALYTIATGQNPTGFTQTLEFRKKIYKLATDYDFIIIEDDPYGYLTLPKYQGPPKKNQFELKDQLTLEDYLTKHLTPSYLEIDDVGRVIRVETFSKLFAPGLRLGFIIADKSINLVIKNYAETVNRGSSGLAQTVVNNVIQDKLGGVDGWLQWVLKMRATYSYRKDLLLQTIYESKAYEKGLVDVIDPKAGMFVTLKIEFLKDDSDIILKMKELLWKVISYGVSVVPGHNMTVDKEFSKSRSNFFRLCYAPANNDYEIIESGKRLTDAILEFYENGEKF